MEPRQGAGKSLLTGIVVGLLLVFLIVVWLVSGGRTGRVGTADRPVSELVVAFVSTDIDDFLVVERVFVVRADGELRSLDSHASVPIEGTSYNSLRDTYAFGGGAATALGAAALADLESPPWVVIPERVWRQIVADAGGMTVDVPVSVNAFVDDALYSLSPGPQTLTDGEVSALAVTANTIEDQEVGRAISEALNAGFEELIQTSWKQVVDSVEQGNSDSSLDPETLELFGGAAFDRS